MGYVVILCYKRKIHSNDNSANYLSALLKRNAGLPLNSWDEVRLNIMEKYPAISLNYACLPDGNIISSDAIWDDEMMREYARFQYYLIFDKE